MSRRRKKKRKDHKAFARPKQGASPAGAEAQVPRERHTTQLPKGREAYERVRSALAHDNPGQALDLARALANRERTEEAEGLLADAYCLRARALAAASMSVEVRSLLAAAGERCPSDRDRFERLAAELAASGGELNQLLEPLNDPDIPRSRRRHIEEAVRCHLTDLSALAGTEALPVDHPLRAGAAALARALEAVTSGPVTDEEVALRQVSRRSPLAPWKVLIRAVACFHRHDDAACQRHLQAVDPASAVAPLVSVLGDLLADGADQRLARGSLALAIYGEISGLRRRLEELDRALQRGKQGPARAAIKRAVSKCKRACPELLPRLGQQVSVRALLEGLPASSIASAMGGPSLKDAHFWRLYALTMESTGSNLALFRALNYWEEFRRHAVHEGWFAPDSVEVSTLYLYMADLLRPIPREDLDVARSMFLDDYDGLVAYYRDQPPSVQAAAPKVDPVHGPDTYFLFPEQLHELAATSGPPDPEVFLRWLQWETERTRDLKRADRAALRWHRALPKDTRPLLHLVQSCSRRGALKKALGYLQEAERLGEPDPALRQTQVKLWAATAVRHLKQGKPHLVDKDLIALEALPQTRSGDRPAFLAALRWVCAGVRGNTQEAEARGREVSELLGCELTAMLILSSLAQRCGLRGRKMPPLPPGSALQAAGAMSRAAARGCALGDALEIPFSLPPAWYSTLSREMGQRQDDLDANQLRTLAEAALRAKRNVLAYDAAGAGLTEEGSTTAEFLLLRARSLPTVAWLRQDKCIAAAVALARQRQDIDLLDRAVEQARHGRGAGSRHHRQARELDGRSLKLGPAEVQQVIAWELQHDSYPRQAFDCNDDHVVYGSCTCAGCQQRRKQLGLEPLEERGDEPGVDEDEPPWLYDDEDDLPLGPGLPGMPPGGLAPMMLQMLVEQGEVSEAELVDVMQSLQQDPRKLAELERLMTEALGEMPPDFMDMDLDMDLDDDPWPPPRRPGRRRKKKTRKQGKRR